jgi:hypothetical protein
MVGDAHVGKLQAFFLLKTWKRKEMKTKQKPDLVATQTQKLTRCAQDKRCRPGCAGTLHGACVAWTVGTEKKRKEKKEKKIKRYQKIAAPAASVLCSTMIKALQGRGDSREKTAPAQAKTNETHQSPSGNNVGKAT